MNAAASSSSTALNNNFLVAAAPLLWAAAEAALAELGPAAVVVASAAAGGYALHKATEGDEAAEVGDSAASGEVAGPSNPIEDLLGDGATVKSNKHGDKVFVSKDGKTKVRFDINESHGDDPHMHVEKQSATGKWKDKFDEHRFYPGKK